MKEWPQFGWWRSWISIALLIGTGACAHPTPPPVCPAPPTQTVVITPAEVGVRYLVAFQSAPSTYLICGTIPPGLVVVAQSGQLWLEGTPTSTGTFTFWIASN